jgi:porin
MCLALVLLTGAAVPSCAFSQELSLVQSESEVTSAEPLAERLLDRRYMLGDWGGHRTELEEHGIVFDFFYQADLLASLNGGYQPANGGFERVRGTVDIDFQKLHVARGLTFHATGVWQAGVNLGSQYIGSVSNPTSLPSTATTRLDQFWLQQSLFSDRVVIKAGQLAGFDLFDLQEYGNSFMNETMGYSPATNYQNYLSYNPGGTPGTEIRVVPVKNTYIKAYAGCGNRSIYHQDPTGMHLTCKDSPVFALEAAIYVHPQDGSSARGELGRQMAPSGYLPGIYKAGATYNPGRFINPSNNVSSLGNYFVYFQANQAIYRQGRVGRDSKRGLDLTFQIGGAPADVNRVNYQFDTGIRYVGPFANRPADSIAVSLVHSHVSSLFDTVSPTTGLPLRLGTENLVEFNYLCQFARWGYFQPVYTYIDNPRGSSTEKLGNANVIGFRVQVHF